MTEITPAHKQLQVQVLSSAGCPATVTAGEPGTQGDTVAGTQGCGVNTPLASAVAAMTCGLVGLLQIPNGLMLAIGAKSMMVAADTLPPCTGLAGDAASEDGDAPKLQVRTAPSTTRMAMCGNPKQMHCIGGACGCRRTGKDIIAILNIARGAAGGKARGATPAQCQS